jgi:hypothetical protein
MRNIIPVQELIRNKRVQELMRNRKPKDKNELPAKLTELQMEEVKKYMKQGVKRDEAVRTVLALDQHSLEKERQISDWNKGGFVNDEKYKQPVKHKIYKK